MAELGSECRMRFMLCVDFYTSYLVNFVLTKIQIVDFEPTTRTKPILEEKHQIPCHTAHYLGGGIIWF